MFSTTGVQLSNVGAIFFSNYAVALDQHPTFELIKMNCGRSCLVPRSAMALLDDEQSYAPTVPNCSGMRLPLNLTPAHRARRGAGFTIGSATGFCC